MKLHLEQEDIDVRKKHTQERCSKTPNGPKGTTGTPTPLEKPPSNELLRQAEKTKKEKRTEGRNQAAGPRDAASTVNDTWKRESLLAPRRGKKGWKG